MLVKTILGTILLMGGIAIILAALFWSFQIFSAKIQPPRVFKINPSITPTPEITPNSISTENDKGIENQIQEVIRTQMEKIFPKENVFQLLNLLAWSVFATFAVFAGEKIASLGIRLLK